jgi:DNA replication and repair protein RecF
MAIKRIILENFRNHQSFVSDVDADVVFICGENGAGKTSILEAISFSRLEKDYAL